MLASARERGTPGLASTTSTFLPIAGIDLTALTSVTGIGLPVIVDIFGVVRIGVLRMSLAKLTELETGVLLFPDETSVLEELGALLAVKAAGDLETNVGVTWDIAVGVLLRTETLLVAREAVDDPGDNLSLLYSVLFKWANVVGMGNSGPLGHEELLFFISNPVDLVSLLAVVLPVARAVDGGAMGFDSCSLHSLLAFPLELLSNPQHFL